MFPALLLLAAIPTAPPAPVADLKLPPGFTARLYADNAIAPDIYTMTIDDAGRVLVAGRGYVRVLVEDGEGSAVRAVDLIDGLKDGPMGLLAEGDSLYVVADGGLKRYRGYNGKEKLKGPPELIMSLKTAGEHDAHAVRRGPDGWLYVLCGNSAGVRKETITGTRSPVQEPVAGALLRVSPDGKQVEVVADGFRNPYSFDFNPDGEPFTYDSDNERCIGLPWYEGCRFYHVVPGGNYGWRSPQLSQTWRKPPYFPDVVPPICDTGRGSPTGVACYRHSHFPASYRGGFFLADWTFGRIYHVPVKAAGSSYSGKHEIFAEATGTSGFAPTALVAHPTTGELFVSIGGRGTRGGVYRIRYDKAEAEPKPLTVAKRSLDFDKDHVKQWLADCASEDARTRRIALEMISRWLDEVPWDKALSAAVKPNLSHADPLVRRAAGRLGKNWFVDLGTVAEREGRLTLALEEARREPVRALKTAFAVLGDDDATNAQMICALRVIQLAYGDLTAPSAVGTVFEGYTFRDTIPRKEGNVLWKALSALNDRAVAGSGSREVRLETIRVLAALGTTHLDEARDYQSFARRITTDCVAKYSFTDGFHCLIASARLPQWSGFDSAAAFFATLSKFKQEKVSTDRNWPFRLSEVATALAHGRKEFSLAVLEHPDFGQPEHAVFAKAIDPASAVAERFLTKAKKDKSYAWTPAVVALLDALPPEQTAETVRSLWDQPGLEDAATRLLARNPTAADYSKFVAGLKSLDPDLVRICARALAALTPEAKTDVYVQSVRAVRRLPDEKANATVRAALVALLQKYSGETIGADAKAWAAWVVKNDPQAERLLNASDGFDAVAWSKRLAGIEWAKGNTDRGRLAFVKATCTACHDGGGAVGPSLLGISKRFGRDDLLTAILQPSKDVSPRYRPTRVVTTDEKAHTGIIVYEATDGVILQTGADTTVRIAGADIASKKQVDVSLMPTGLLDKLTDAEIADLLAYLATLGDPKPK